MKNKLKYLRRSEKFDLTQQELAEKIGISAKTIANIENGKLPTLETAFALTQFFNCKFEDIFVSE